MENTMISLERCVKEQGKVIVKMKTNLANVRDSSQDMK